VKGGVHSVEELREMVARDPALAAHYAGFKYEKARLTRLKKPELVYLSYRMNGKIFWTGKPLKLAAGEPVLTDGVITARTKCGNQISVQKQMAVSPEEPPLQMLDQMSQPQLPPTEVHFPAQFQTALLTSPVDPQSPLDPPGGAGFWPIVLPPLPAGGGGGSVCIPGGQEGNGQSSGAGDNNETVCPEPPPPPSPSPVPEPGALLLLSTGLLSVYGVYRKKNAILRNR
jgi:hypothetical protein